MARRCESSRCASPFCGCGCGCWQCAGTPETHAFKTDECRLELTGLRPGMAYKVRVMARNKSGFGDKGPVSVMRTEAVTLAPTNLQVCSLVSVWVFRSCALTCL
jgi:hypothetical protein